MKKKTTKRKFLTTLTLAFAMLLSCIMIPATENTAHAAAKLTVTAPKTVTVGKTVKVKTNISCKFKSSNTKIATVSSKGTVKGKKAGVVKITATSKKYPTLKKTVKITVKKAGTAKLVGISATYKQKVPKGSAITGYGAEIKAKYSDGTTKIIEPSKINSSAWEWIKSEGNYEYYKLTYDKFSTEVKVETVEISDDIMLPFGAIAEYTGQPIEPGAEISLKDVTGKMFFTDGSSKDFSKYAKKVLFSAKLDDYGISVYKVLIEYKITYNEEDLYVYLFANLNIPIN